MTVQKKIKTKQKLLDIINYFKELPFYNTYIGKPKIKRLKTFIYFLSFLFMKNEVKADKAMTYAKFN